MVCRRSFALGSLALAGVSLTGSAAWIAKRATFDSECSADCFQEDWLQFDYDDFYHSIFERSRSNRLTAVASGPAIKAEIREAFGGEHLHDAMDASLQVLSTRTTEDFALHKLRFDLDCGLPVLGCAAVPRGTPRGLVLLAHGMATTPERCFRPCTYKSGGIT
jgi:hypothetical protein